MAWLTVPALIGPVVGPPLGGLIVTYASWRWIFDINVPIGVLGMILVTLFVEDVREPEAGRFDLRGLFLSGIGLAGLMAGLETIGRGLITPALTALLIAIGLAASCLYLAHARHHPKPLLDLSLLRLPTFRISVFSGTLFRIGIGAIPYLLPLMLQLGFGRSPAQSGAITFASSAGALVMKPATQSALRWLGFRTTLLWNGVVSALLLAAMAAFRPTWPLAAIYAVLLTGGFFRSLQFTAYNTIAYADVHRRKMSAATALYSTVQQLSQVIGISIGAAALEAITAISQRAMPSLYDYSIAFLVVAAISLTSTPAALFLPRDAGAELSGHRLPQA
jgi:MFS family permease